ncbi:hypothetical protein A4A49_39875, partial [Nicotiana attenuata]
NIFLNSFFKSSPIVDIGRYSLSCQVDKWVKIQMGCKSPHAIAGRKDNQREKLVEASNTKDKGKKIKNASAMQQNVAIKPKKRKRVSTEEVQCDKLPVKNQVLRFLMSRELVQDSEDEFHVKINHSTLCFGIREFAIISGLRCVGEVNDEETYNGSNRLKEAYFFDRDRVSKDDLIDCFMEKDGNPNIVTRVASRVPQILNWNVTERPSFEKLCSGMLGESSNKLVFTNISATVDELGALYLPINVEFAPQEGVVSEDVCQFSVNESGYITPPFKRSNKQQLRNIKSNAPNDQSFLEGKYSISDFEKLRREYESFKKFAMESFEKVFNGNIPAHDYDQRSDENVENDFEKLSKNFCLFKEYVMDSFAKLFDENNNLHNRFTEKSDSKSDGKADEQGNVDIGSPNNHHEHGTNEVIHVHETIQMNIISQVNQGDTNVLHHRLESVAECQKDLPTFDGGDYLIPSESQIAIIEQTAVEKAVEVANDPTPKQSTRVRRLYRKRHDIDLTNIPYSDRPLADPLDIHLVDDLPQQEHADCGVYVASFAEYFIHQRSIPAVFDAEQHRK